jgi:hypothetical protein
MVTITGPTGLTYVVQASSNLVNWTPILTNVPASTPFSLSDSNSSSLARRFYRAILLP